MTDSKKIEVPMILRSFGVTPEIMQEVAGIGEQLRKIPSRMDTFENDLQSVQADVKIINEKLDIILLTIKGRT